MSRVKVDKSWPGQPPIFTRGSSSRVGEEADERILGLSRDENLETVLDFETGKQLYIGRVRPPDAS